MGINVSRKYYNKIAFLLKSGHSQTSIWALPHPSPSINTLPDIVLIVATISLSNLTMLIIGLIAILTTASFYLALPSMGLLEIIPTHEAFITSDII
jgi:hypothetical protein